MAIAVVGGTAGATAVEGDRKTPSVKVKIMSARSEAVILDGRPVGTGTIKN